MNRKVLKKWVAALRSGEFKQTKRCLEDLKGNCCLGVLCNLALLEGVCDFRRGGIDDRLGIFDSSGGSLPKSVMDWSGLKDSHQSALITLNDWDGKSFKEIADYIEQRWL